MGDGTDQRPRILEPNQPQNETPLRETDNSALRNLKLNDGAYRYRSAEQGELLEVKVYYCPGGRNDWSGDIDPQGVWIGVFPTKMNNGVTNVTLFEGPEISGLRFFVIEGCKDDREKLGAVAEHFDEIAPEVARIWKAENECAVQMIVGSIDEIRHGPGGGANNARAAAETLKGEWRQNRESGKSNPRFLLYSIRRRKRGNPQKEI